MRISRDLLEEIVAHALDDHPNECCGFVAANGNHAVAIHRMSNVAEQPGVRYELSGLEHYQVLTAIEEEGLEVGAIYHSHPHSPPFPSTTDIELAFYPKAEYIIVSLEQMPTVTLGCWRMDNGEVDYATLEIEDNVPGADPGIEVGGTTHEPPQ